MSNASIVSRLVALADDLEHGRVSLRVAASELIGHAEALERMEYHQVKEAQLVQGQLLQAIETHREDHVDRRALVGWLRDWVRKVPVDAV
jgi:hypothetical protein